MWSSETIHPPSPSGSCSLRVPNGANEHVRDKRGIALLHNAAAGGHLSCMKFLIDNGANVDIKDMERETPIHYAAEGGHVSCIELLLSKNATVKFDCSSFTISPILKALPRDICRVSNSF